MNALSGSLAVITGASVGIGLELARLCARQGCELVIAADEERIVEAAQEFRQGGVACVAVQCDLATLEGVDAVLQAVEQTGKPVELLLANAGRGLGRAFLDQEIVEALKVVHTNIDGTIYLIQRVGNQMRAAGKGRILITGSIAGLMPGTFQAVYTGTQAFLDSFSVALSNEIKDSGVSVTCLMPGATETDFFERADLCDPKLGTEEKASAADVAQVGFEAMMKGELKVVAGFASKLRARAHSGAGASRSR